MDEQKINMAFLLLLSSFFMFTLVKIQIVEIERYKYIY